jgi:hypothetical protein
LEHREERIKMALIQNEYGIWQMKFHIV